MKTVLLLGSYGQTNIGDDILMDNYVRLLRNNGFKKIFVNANVVSNVPGSIKGIVVKETYKTPIFEWLRIIQEVDLICYGGGTIYKELYSSTSRKKYGVILRMVAFNFVARLFGKKIVNLHIGIGSLKTWFGKLLTKLGIGLSTYTIFRDHQSYVFAKDMLRIPAHKLCSGKDGLFIDTKWHIPRLNDFLQLKPKVIGFNALSDIPDWVDRGKYLTELRLFLNHLLEQKYRIIFFPFQHSFNPRNDTVFIKNNLIKYLRGNNFELLDHIPIDQISGAYQKVDLFIGMRFHSLLLALSNTTPFLAIEYDTKCSRFIEENSYPHSIKIESFSFPCVTKSFNTLVERRNEAYEKLQFLGTKFFNSLSICDKTFLNQIRKEKE